MTLERFQIVVDAAETLCQRAFDLPDSDEIGAFLRGESERRGFNQEERVLLAALCVSYANGRQDQLRR